MFSSGWNDPVDCAFAFMVVAFSLLLVGGAFAMFAAVVRGMGWL